jgi:hypothetical protein
MAKLEAQDASWAGIVAFYSIIRIPQSEVVAALSEWRRVLQTGGLALLPFHRGQQEQHVDSLWGKQISLDFTFFVRPKYAMLEAERTGGPGPFGSVPAPPDRPSPTERAHLIVTSIADGSWGSQRPSVDVSLHITA